jgi:DNA segregation ATPase FtsK/SpoIIIE-like protein
MGKDKKDLVVSFALFGAALLLLAALISYSPYDIRFETSSPNLHTRNYIGIVGAYTVWFIFKLIGLAGFFIPLLCIVWGIGILAERLEQRPLFRYSATLLLLCAGASLSGLTAAGDSISMIERGGLTGFFISKILLEYFGSIGSYIITFMLTALALLVATEFLIVPLTSFLFLQLWNFLGNFKKEEAKKKVFKKAEGFEPGPRLRPAVKVDKRELRTENLELREKKRDEDVKEKIEERSILPKIQLPKPKLAPKPMLKKPVRIEPRVVGDYKLPSLELLKSPPPESERMLGEDWKQMQES